MNREIGLLIAVIVAVVLIVVTVKRLNTLEDKHQISKGRKDFLLVITILVPLIGFLITLLIPLKDNQNIA